MNRIKEARIAAGLSQKYVATTLGVAGPSVSNWESGKTKPTTENYASLAALLNVSVDYLIGNDVIVKTIPDGPTEQATLVSTRMREFMEEVQDLSDNEIEVARLFLKQLKKSREKKNPLRRGGAIRPGRFHVGALTLR